jgi:hypothetical protein
VRAPACTRLPQFYAKRIRVCDKNNFRLLYKKPCFWVIFSSLQRYDCSNKPKGLFIMTAQTSKTFATRRAMLAAHRLAASSADLDAILNKEKSDFFFSQAVSDKIDALGIDTAQIFATDRNPKVIKRFIQFVHALNAKQYKSIDVTSATIIYALHLAGENPLTTDALHYVGAGLKSGKVSPETRGVSRMTVNKLFGRVGLSTIPTQASRTVGRNGYLQLCGATSGEPGKKNQSVKLNEKHPLIVAFFDVMNAATQGQIDDMIGE